jgi:hypothetical protein
MLISCPECKKQISDHAEACPECGYPLGEAELQEIHKQAEKEQKLTNGCGVGCLLVIALLVVIGSFSSGGSSGSSSPARSNSSSNTSISRPAEMVINSAWDGSVSQVKTWLKANLKDPKSLECIEWSKVSKQSDGGYMVRVKYRAKNGFGGYVVENKVFFLDSTGTVLYNIDFE